MDKTHKKGPSLRSWIRERMLFLAMLIFVGGATLYIGSTKLFDPESIWLHPVKEFALLTAMIGVVSLGYELFLRELTFSEYKRALQEIVNPHAVRLGIQGIYKNRSELGQAVTFQDLFKKVKKEIFIGGSSLLSISTGSRDLLKEKVLGGTQVRLLLVDPDSEVANLIAQQGGGKQTFINEIRTSILLLQRLQDEIAESQGSSKGKLLIHTYQNIPSHSFISVDTSESSGLIIADIGPYLGRNNQRPSLMMTPKKHGLFDHYRDLNEALWKDSHPISAEKSTPVTRRKTRTQLFTSGPETEYLDKETKEWQPAFICEANDNWRGLKGSQWVWVRDKVTLEEAKTGSKQQFRLKFDVPNGKVHSSTRAELLVRSDDVCHITVNDVSLRQEYGGASYPDPFIIDFDRYLTEGTNTVTFEVTNYAMPQVTLPDDNPAGLIYRLHLEMPE